MAEQHAGPSIELFLKTSVDNNNTSSITHACFISK